MQFIGDVETGSWSCQGRWCSHMPKVLLLVGMRGVGKTTLGRSLHCRFPRVSFVDMDEHFCSVSGFSSISAFVDQHGWGAFRELEVRYLNHVVSDLEKQTVIACGGGIVETAQGRELLESFQRDPSILIVHIKRKDIEIEYNAQRPPLPLSTQETWNRRRPYYESLCHAEYLISLPHDLTRFTRYLSILIHRPLQSPSVESTVFSQNSSYACLSVPPTMSETVTPGHLSGMHAVEYRADLLEDPENTWQALLQFRERIAFPIPICFTIRSRAHGGLGSLPASVVVQILHEAARFGCSWLDVEWPGKENQNASWLSDLIHLCHGKRVLPILSWHGPIKDLATWDRIYQEMTSWILEKAPAVQIWCKIISTTSDVDGYYSWMDKRWKGLQNGGKTYKIPCIAHCMGISESERYTRVHQAAICPRDLASPLIFYAPEQPGTVSSGQYTIKEMNQLLVNLDIITPKSFFITGSPIQHSLSPAMHQAAFDALGLPYTYQRLESNDAQQVLTELRSMDSFGGASVTMPLKQEITSAASSKSIKCHSDRSVTYTNNVVNTLVRLGSDELFVCNTDWLAFHNLVQEKLEEDYIVIILGAGATAHSTIYAVSHLSPPPTSLYIWNRTEDKISSLISMGAQLSLKAFKFSASDLPQNTKVIIVSCIPDASAFSKDQLQPWISGSRSVLFVDWSYMVQSDLSCILENHCSSFSIPFQILTGKDLLLQQALYQSHLWLRFAVPPVATMRNAIYK